MYRKEVLLFIFKAITIMRIWQCFWWVNRPFCKM